MIRLTRPQIPEQAIHDAVAVLKSGNLIQGQFVKKFEELLAEFLDIKFAIAVSSGTAALHLALMALNIKCGDEVIVPAFTFPATANVVEMVGAKPVLVDISLDDFCIDTSKIEQMITAKTKAVIPVHEFGQTADMDPVISVAQKHNLLIIEDAACGLGAEYKQRKAGTMGTLGCFSFHPRKAITTGEGGLVVTDDDALADKIYALRNHGMKTVNDAIDFITVGLNYRMTDFQAAIGIPQMKKIGFDQQRRAHIAKQYSKILGKNNKIRTPKVFKDRKHVYQTYHIVLDERIERDRLIDALRAQGIESNKGAQGLNCLFFYKMKYGYSEADFPNSAKAYKQGLALPIGMHLKDTDISLIIETLLQHLD